MIHLEENNVDFSWLSKCSAVASLIMVSNIFPVTDIIQTDLLSPAFCLNEVLHLLKSHSKWLIRMEMTIFPREGYEAQSTNVFKIMLNRSLYPEGIE